MIRFIKELNIPDITLCENPNKFTRIKRVKEKMRAKENSDWKLNLNKNGNETNGNKLRTYRLYKDTLQTGLTPSWSTPISSTSQNSHFVYNLYK